MIMYDSKLSNEEKIIALESLKNKDLSYKINRWLGQTLNKHEKRLLRALRRIIDQTIKQKKIITVGKSLYEVEIPLTMIYEEYGLTKRKDGSYNHDQTKDIQSILFGITSKGLHRDILFKHKNILKTRFILQVETIKQGKIQEQCLGIRITVPRILFVPEDEASNFYYQDTEGFKRFMAIPGMSKSDTAFNIAEYLERYLSNRQEKRTLDLETLIKEGDEAFQKRYTKNSGRVKDTIRIILDNMKKAEYLLKEWKLDKGKYDQEQFSFINLRYKLSNNNKINQIENSKSKAKTTKNRNIRDKSSFINPPGKGE